VKRTPLGAGDAAAWNAQMHRVRLLHQFTYNTDYRNVRNVPIDPAFRIYAVDSSRAFRIQADLMTPDDLVCFSRVSLERLAALDRPTVEARLGSWLGKSQIDGLLARRGKILALAKQRVAERVRRGPGSRPRGRAESRAPPASPMATSVSLPAWADPRLREPKRNVQAIRGSTSSTRRNRSIAPAVWRRVSVTASPRNAPPDHERPRCGRR
jgi:hypothetical protein